MRRPLWWSLALAVALGAIVAADVYWSRVEERSWADHGRSVTGAVEPSYGGGADVPVRYTHPVTGQTVSEVAFVVDPQWDPPPGAGPVELLVDERDPGRVRIAGDPLADATEGIAWALVLAGAPLLWWAARRVSLARMQRLARGTRPTLVLLGRIEPPRRFGRRCELHLWPLDSPPQSPSICRIPLAATSGVPIGGPVFQVEVKGAPRPFGTMAARVRSSAIPLWTVTRAHLGGARPRPSAVGDPPQLPAPQPYGPLPGPALGPFVALPLAALVASAVLVLVMSAVVWRSTSEKTRIRQSGEPRLVTVVDRDDAAGSLVVQFDEGGQARTATASVTDVGEYPQGNVYPARVDLSAERAVLDAQRLGWLSAVLWSAVPFVAVLAYLVHRVRHWRHLRRLASRGLWRRVGLVRSPGGSRDVIVDPDAGAVFASVRIGATTRPAPAPEGAPPYLPVLAAGDVEPGGDVVLASNGTAVAVTARASAAEIPSSPDEGNSTDLAR